MPGVINENFVGPTRAQLGMASREGLSDALRNFAAQRFEEKRFSEQRAENARRYVLDLANGNDFGIQGIFMNKELALGLRDTVGRALGTTDPVKIEAFIAGAANSISDSKTMEELGRAMYMRGDLVGKDPEAAKDPMAPYYGAWRTETFWKPEATPAPTPVTVAPASPRAVTPSPVSPVMMDRRKTGIRSDIIQERAAALAPRADVPSYANAQEYVAGNLNREANTPQETPESRFRAKVMTMPGAKANGLETLSTNLLVGSYPEIAKEFGLVPDNMGVGADSPQPAPAGQPVQPDSGPSVAERRFVADIRAQKANDPAELANIDRNVAKGDIAYLRSAYRNTAAKYFGAEAPQAVPVSTDISTETPKVLPSGGGTSTDRDRVWTSDAYQKMTPEEQVLARYLGDDKTLTPQERRQAEAFQSRLVAETRKTAKTTYDATPAARAAFDERVLASVRNSLDVTQLGVGGENNTILAPLFLNSTDIAKRKALADLESVLLDNAEKGILLPYIEQMKLAELAGSGVEELKANNEAANIRLKALGEIGKDIDVMLVVAGEELAKDPENRKAQDKYKAVVDVAMANQPWVERNNQIQKIISEAGGGEIARRAISIVLNPAFLRAGSGAAYSMFTASAFGNAGLPAAESVTGTGAGAASNYDSNPVLY